MSFWQFSVTASSNQNADPSVLFTEGQAPSTLNDASRALMASLAAWRQDTSGERTTAGGATAFTYTTSSSANLAQTTPATPFTGMRLRFQFNVQPNSTATLAVDGGTAFGIFVGGSANVSGQLITGVPYSFEFDGSHWNACEFYAVTNSGNISTGQLPANQIIREFAAAKDGGGSTVSTGLIFYFYIPITITPTNWWIIGDGSTGSSVCDFQTSGGSTMTGGGAQRPQVSSGVSATSSNLSAWTSPVTPGFYQFTVISVATFTKLTVGWYGNAT